MPAITKLAKTTEELSDILKLRYGIWKASGRLDFPHIAATKRIIDHFDVYPSTRNFVVYRDGTPAGALRSVNYDPADESSNSIFDWRETSQNIATSACLLDMLVMDGATASRKDLIQTLVSMPLFCSARERIGHALFLVPDILKEHLTKIGFVRVADSFRSRELATDVQPMVCNLKKFYDEIVGRIIDREILKFEEIFYLTYFDSGEIVALQGEPGSSAYLILEGEMDVLIRNENELISVSQISPGRLTGEIAMATNEPRTASLVAKSECICISIDRGEFLRLLQLEPHRSIDVFKIFSKRLNDSNRKMSESKGFL